jgi:hypothetical protein
MTPRIPALFALVALTSCETSTPLPAGQSDAGASPNASILPAPLATEPPELPDSGADDGAVRGIPADPAGRLLVADAGPPPPESMRPASPIPAEAVPLARDAPGVALDAVFRWRDVPAPPKAPEVSADGIREAQKLTALTLRAELSDAGRMRVEFTSAAFPLPAHSEIRARNDHYGNLVFWPNAAEYRVIPPGALRALLGERRVDVTPLSAGTAKAQGEGKRLGVTVRKLELGSSVGSVKLELGKVPEAGEGGALLCRALVELAGIDPRTPACQAGEVPLAAAYGWHEGGGIALEVTSIAKRPDLPVNMLLVPPPTVAYAPAGLPAAPHGIFLTREALAAFRAGPLTLPPSKDASVPGEGFVAVNHSDRLMYLLVDGVPVVAVPPHADRYVIGPVRGRYLVQWRSFLGEKVAAPQAVEMPARIVHGSVPDGGAPDGG